MLGIRYLVPLKNKIGIDLPAKKISKEVAYYRICNAWQCTVFFVL